jgi:hypothetical protein
MELHECSIYGAEVTRQQPRESGVCTTMTYVESCPEEASRMCVEMPNEGLAGKNAVCRRPGKTTLALPWQGPLAHPATGLARALGEGWLKEDRWGAYPVSPAHNTVPAERARLPPVGGPVEDSDRAQDGKDSDPWNSNVTAEVIKRRPLKPPLVRVRRSTATVTIGGHARRRQGFGGGGGVRGRSRRGILFARYMRRTEQLSEVLGRGRNCATPTFTKAPIIGSVSRDTLPRQVVAREIRPGDITSSRRHRGLVVRSYMKARCLACEVSLLALRHHPRPATGGEVLLEVPSMVPSQDYLYLGRVGRKVVHSTSRYW